MVTHPARAACATGAAGLLLLLVGCGPGGQTGPGPAGTRPASTGPQMSRPASPAGSGAAAAPAATASVCALITQQEASAAFGAQSSPPQPAASGPAGSKACAYFANASQDSLQVSLLRGASQAQLSAIESSVQPPGAVTTSASGIGSSATVMRAGPTAMVIFTKQSALVIVILNMIGYPAPVHAAVVLAKDAAALL
jgi:hypothetical protein